MLAQKQSKCKYLSNTFYETECCGFLGIIFVLTLCGTILYLWFEVHAVWFKTKDIVPIMCMEVTIVFWGISTIFGILNVYETKRKNPNVPLFKILGDNAGFFAISMAIIGSSLLVGLVWCVYNINIWALKNDYLSNCVGISNSTANLENRASDCTFVELFIFPVFLFIIIMLCCLVCTPLIEALQILRKRSAIYDESQILQNQKDNV